MLPLFCNAFGKVCLRVILSLIMLLMECACTYVCSVYMYIHVCKFVCYVIGQLLADSIHLSLSLLLFCLSHPSCFLP